MPWALCLGTPSRERVENAVVCMLRGYFHTAGFKYSLPAAAKLCVCQTLHCRIDTAAKELRRGALQVDDVPLQSLAGTGLLTGA